MDKILSIAIPTYNRKKYLKRALDSIMSQLDNRIEILVSDNASTDGTSVMMKSEYPNVRYLSNSNNIGGEANFQKCCESSEGKYFLLLGSDDVLIEGAIEKILNFLDRDNDFSLVFLNHVFFEGDYIDLNHCTKKWSDSAEDIITTDKEVLMEYAKCQISYMSSIIFSKAKYDRVQRPQQYFWTYFFHTNVAFEVLKNKDSLIGIIGSYCIADNVTIGESTVEAEKMKFFEVFGKGLEYSLCTHAVDCGFDSKQMRKIYSDFAKSNFPKMIIKNKANVVKNSYDWKAEFTEYVRPILKRYPTLFFFTIPFYLLPNWLAKFIRNYIRPFYNRIKK